MFAGAIAALTVSGDALGGVFDAAQRARPDLALVIAGVGSARYAVGSAGWHARSAASAETAWAGAAGDTAIGIRPADSAATVGHALFDAYTARRALALALAARLTAHGVEPAGAPLAIGDALFDALAFRRAFTFYTLPASDTAIGIRSAGAPVAIGFAQWHAFTRSCAIAVAEPARGTAIGVGPADSLAAIGHACIFDCSTISESTVEERSTVES